MIKIKERKRSGLDRENGHGYDIENLSDIDKLLFIYNNAENGFKFKAGRKLYRRYKDIGRISDGIKLLKELADLNPKAEYLKREIDICSEKLQMLNDSKYYVGYIGQKADRWFKPGKVEEKVLHVLNSSIPYLNNGYCIRSKYIVENQNKVGIQPVVITRPGFPNDFFKNMLKDDNELIKEEMNEITYYRCLPRLIMRHTPLKKYSEAYSDMICRVIDLESPDIIHAASNYINGLAGLDAARRKHKPFVYEIRGFWEMTTVAKEPLFKDSEEFRLAQKIENYLLHEADQVITISNSLKEEIIKRGISSEKVEVIPNGVDCECFKPVDYNSELGERYGLRGKFVIGYIGSIVQYEGLQNLIKVIARLKDEDCSNIRFLIVGDGNYLKVLKELVAELRLGEEVIFTRRIPHEEVTEYYSLFDLCVFPRVDEEVTNLITPLKPLEAMACTKVVIGSNLDAIKEMIIPDINGFIFDNTEGDLYEKIKQLYEKSKLRNKMKSKARNWVVKNRDWVKLSRDLKEIYKKLIL